MKLSKQHVFQEWVSSIFGLFILALALIYLGKLIWFTPEKVSGTELATTLGIAAIGIIFLFVKIEAIMRYLPGGNPPQSEDIPTT